MITQTEAETFRRSKSAEAARARCHAAFFLATGIDLEEAEKAPPDQRAHIVRRLGRLVERERLKGARRHWSYDLNRHVALAQALDRLRKGVPAQRRAPER